MEMSETFGFSNFCNSEIHKVKSSADKEDFKGLTCKQKELEKERVHYMQLIS